MNADGINYLDIGDAYMRCDFEVAINSVWSPLYSWILGAVMAVVQPSMRWEFPVVHLVNFGIYIVALVCFEFLWRQLWRYQETKAADKVGIRGTPGFVINGYFLSGAQPYTKFKKLIERSLREQP